MVYGLWLGEIYGLWFMVWGDLWFMVYGLGTFSTGSGIAETYWISDAASARTWAEPGASNSWSAHDAAPRTADRSSQSNAVIGEVGAGLLESSTPCSRPPLCCSAVHDVSIETSEPTARSTARRRLLDAASRHVRAAWAAAASDATEDGSTSTPKVVRSAATEAATVAAAAE